MFKSQDRYPRGWGASKIIKLILLFPMMMFAASSVFADDEVTVTIQRVQQIDCVDELFFWCESDAEFYSSITIDGAEFTTPVINNSADISPNWTISQFVSSRVINVRIEVWDADDFLRFGDDELDLTPGGGRSINLTLNLDTCAFTGGVAGSCAVTIVSSGTGNDRAQISFQIDVTPAQLGEIEVVVERLTTLDCLDDFFGACVSAADYYARVGIDGLEQSNKGQAEAVKFSNHDDAATYWRVSRWVNLNQPSIPIDIRIMDDDWFSDDTVDVQPGGGRVLNLSLNLAACTLSGDATGRCGDIVDVASRMDLSGDQAGRARLQVRVNLYRQPRLYVRCLHSPIWPQTGDAVTFNVEALDANMRPVIADSIALRQPAESDPGSLSCENASSCELILNANSEGRFSYSCTAEVNGIISTTGNRISTIGTPAGTGRAIAVLEHQNDTIRAMDMIFIADVDSYPNPNVMSFRNSIHSVIRDAYLSDELFLRNQNRFNYWIALDQGNAHGYTEGEPCHTAPANWATDYSFSDSGILLHTDNLRDCAQGGIFSSEPNNIATIRHETGHSPFGLADEYCCDGGYFQQAINPNMYGPEIPGTDTSLNTCQADSLAGLRDSCIGFTSTRGSSEDQFFRLDHAPASRAVSIENDLMIDNMVPRAADDRRIQAVINTLP